MISYLNNKCKGFAYVNGKYAKLKKGHVYEGGVFKKIYSAGGTVTYIVNGDEIYKEEVDSGQSCLSPKTFAPKREGYSFKGWSETEKGTVLTSKEMDDNPITLYAVWKRDTAVLLNTNDNERYYWNGGNIVYTAPDGYSTTWYKMDAWVAGFQNDDWISVDCTDYNTCTIRVYGQIISHPKGTTSPKAYIRAGMTDDFESATTLVLAEGYGHWGDTDNGWQFIHDGCSYSGVANNKWYDLTLDVSELTGMHNLKAFIGGNAQNHVGYLYCSKITMSAD